MILMRGVLPSAAKQHPQLPQEGFLRPVNSGGIDGVDSRCFVSAVEDFWVHL